MNQNLTRALLEGEKQNSFRLFILFSTIIIHYIFGLTLE